MNKKSTKLTYIIAIVVGVLTCCAVALFIIAPWKSKDQNNNSNGGSSNTSSQTADYNKKGKCKFYECLTKLSADSSKEEATSVIGFEPEEEISDTGSSSGGSRYKYTWDFDDDHSIVLTAYKFTGHEIKTSSIELKDYEYKDLVNSRVNLDKLSEIKSNLNKGDGVSYSQFKEYVGGIDGTIIELGSSSTTYEWVAGDGKSHVSGSFNKAGRCTFMNGMTY